jgi:hypothetical protein
MSQRVRVPHVHVELWHPDSLRSRIPSVYGRLPLAGPLRQRVRVPHVHVAMWPPDSLSRLR